MASGVAQPLYIAGQRASAVKRPALVQHRLQRVDRIWRLCKVIVHPVQYIPRADGSKLRPLGCKVAELVRVFGYIVKLLAVQQVIAAVQRAYVKIVAKPRGALADMRALGQYDMVAAVPEKVAAQRGQQAYPVVPAARGRGFSAPATRAPSG